MQQGVYLLDQIGGAGARAKVVVELGRVAPGLRPQVAGFRRQVLL